MLIILPSKARTMQGFNRLGVDFGMKMHYFSICHINNARPKE